MEISNVSQNTQAAAAPPAQTVSREDNTRPPVQPPSSVVNISDEAKKLDEQKNAQRAAEAREAAQKQAESKPVEAPGIEFVSGASKGGKVNTFA